MLALFAGMLYRMIVEMKRYYMISSIIVIVIIFVLIVLGFRSFGGPAASESLKDTALGYFLWTVMLFSMTDLSWTIMNEMQRGIIEQEFLSPFGPATVFLMYEVAYAAVTLPIFYGMMVIIFSMAGMSIAVPPTFFLFLIGALIQSMGIGMILAGITLRFKRTNALLQLAQFAVIGLLFLDASGWKALVIPISPYFKIMKGIIAGNGFDPKFALFTAAGTLIYAVVGMLFFKYFERGTRIRGDLSVY